MSTGTVSYFTYKFGCDPVSSKNLIACRTNFSSRCGKTTHQYLSRSTIKLYVLYIKQFVHGNVCTWEYKLYFSLHFISNICTHLESVNKNLSREKEEF